MKRALAIAALTVVLPASALAAEILPDRSFEQRANAIDQQYLQQQRQQQELYNQPILQQQRSQPERNRWLSEHRLELRKACLADTRASKGMRLGRLAWKATGIEAIIPGAGRAWFEAQP